MRRFALVLILATLAPLGARGEEAAARGRGFGMGNDHVRFSGRIQSLALWRNDRDFDRTDPFYDAQGQDVGVLGTFVAPLLEVMPAPELRMAWETEVGLNLWSMQDADQYGTGSDRFFRLAIRQLYMEGRFFDGALGFRTGYEQLFDPSGLFLGHWLGAAGLSTAHPWGALRLTVAQIPDQTYEGVAFDANNFRSDTFVFGVRGDFPLSALTLTASVWGLHDTQVVDQTLDLVTGTARLAGAWSQLTFAADANLQFGVTRGRAAGRDETTLAWSAQGTLDWMRPLTPDLSLLLHLNALALSGDDDHDGNDWNGAWFYSGKSRSRTLLLTEDELRDRGGNLDERLAERRQGDGGKFYLVRPGLQVTDLSLGLDVMGFFRPMATVGAGFVLNPDNALGGRFVGLESDLHLEFRYRDLLSVDLVGSYLMPGAAAAAFVNRTGDRDAVDPVFQVEAVATMWF